MREPLSRPSRSSVVSRRADCEPFAHPGRSSNRRSPRARVVQARALRRPRSTTATGLPSGSRFQHPGAPVSRGRGRPGGRRPLGRRARRTGCPGGRSASRDRAWSPGGRGRRSAAGGAPLRGSCASTSARFDISPVSSPAMYGEFADNASTTGSQGKTPSSAWKHASALGMPTWTWSPLTPCLRAETPA